jgi:hypothetical protein
MCCLKNGPILRAKNKTPIINARNLGPVSAQILESVGVSTLEELKKRGWQKVAFEVSQAHPGFLNLNMFRALIGACLDCDWREIPENDLAEARSLMKALRGR